MKKNNLMLFLAISLFLPSFLLSTDKEPFFLRDSTVKGVQIGLAATLGIGSAVLAKKVTQYPQVQGIIGILVSIASYLGPAQLFSRFTLDYHLSHVTEQFNIIKDNNLVYIIPSLDALQSCSSYYGTLCQKCYHGSFPSYTAIINDYKKVYSALEEARASALFVAKKTERIDLKKDAATLVTHIDALIEKIASIIYVLECYKLDNNLTDYKENYSIAAFVAHAHDDTYEQKVISVAQSAFFKEELWIISACDKYSSYFTNLSQIASDSTRLAGQTRNTELATLLSKCRADAQNSMERLRKAIVILKNQDLYITQLKTYQEKKAKDEELIYQRQKAHAAQKLAEAKEKEAQAKEKLAETQQQAVMLQALQIAQQQYQQPHPPKPDIHVHVIMPDNNQHTNDNNGDNDNGPRN